LEVLVEVVAIDGW